MTQPETVNVSVSKADQAIHSINRSFSPIASCLRVRARRLVPHGRCDLPALIVGCNVLRHIKWSLSSQVCLAVFYTLPRLRNVPFFLKGVPRQEHTREATSYLFYISPDTPAGGMGWPLGRGWSQPERGGKKEGARGSYSLMLHCRIDFKVCVASWQHLKNFYLNFVLPTR